jgi:hypothetical protein
MPLTPGIGTAVEVGAACPGFDASNGFLNAAQPPAAANPPTAPTFKNSRRDNLFILASKPLSFPFWQLLDEDLAGRMFAQNVLLIKRFDDDQSIYRLNLDHLYPGMGVQMMLIQ